MKKKIAIITERVNIALGGAERSVFEMASAFEELGLEVDILAAKGQTDHGRTKNIHILCQQRTGRHLVVCKLVFQASVWLFAYLTDLPLLSQ